MNKKTLLLLLCVITATVMNAKQLTAEQARATAREFVNRNATNRSLAKAKASAATEVLPYGTDAAGRTMIYAVNVGKNAGFVLVGANDRSDEVIGYCDHGTFDAQKLPANMRSWLDSYVASASVAGKSAAAAHRVRSTTAAATKSYIPPLLKSQWNQDSPYNDRCPIINGKHAATGCTFTAIAQIMYYHKWPNAVTKDIPAFTPTSADYPSLTALPATTLDWNKMYNNYKNGEDGSEVAKLFIYLGTAAKALYGTTTGVFGYEVLQTLKDYFDYDQAAYTVWRQQLGYRQWVDMLYAELQAGRPVFFSGSSPEAGHSFVVDGYDEEDYFHVNWGWGGEADGYYRVLLMNPKDSQSDESLGEFKAEQVALIGVQPNGGYNGDPERLTVLQDSLYYDPTGNNEYNAIGNQSTSPYFENNGYLVCPSIKTHNYNGIEAEFALGCRLIKNDGSVARDYEWETAKYEIDKGKDKQMHMVYLNPTADPELTDGNYRMFFTSKLKSAAEWQYDIGSENHYIDIYLDHAHGSLTATAVSNEPQMKMLDFKIETATPRVDAPVDITCKLQNQGNGVFHGNVGITYVVNNEAEWLDYKDCDFEPGETQTLKFSFKPKKAGMLEFNLTDALADPLHKASITVAESDLTDNCDLTITHRVTNAEGTEIIGDKALVELTVTNNSDKTYYGDVTLHTFKWTSETHTFDYTTKSETVAAGQTVVIKRESVVLSGAERYSFRTSYSNDGDETAQDDTGLYYTVVPAYIAYDATGNAGYRRAAAGISPDAAVCAVDLRNAPEVKSVNTAANPNIIIIAANESNMSGDNIVKDGKAENVKLSNAYPFYSPLTFNAEHISYTLTPSVNYDIKSNKGWTTLVLPFAADGCQTTIDGAVTPLNWYIRGRNTGDILLATFTAEDGSTLSFDFPEGSILNPCHPYLLGVPATLSGGRSIAGLPITFYAHDAIVGVGKASVTGVNYKMMGTFTSVGGSSAVKGLSAGNSGSATYTLDGEGAAFVPATQTIAPFSAFFLPIAGEAAPQLAIDFSFRHSTAIGTIDSDRTIDANAPIYNLNGQRVTNPAPGIYITGGKKVIIK